MTETTRGEHRRDSVPIGAPMPVRGPSGRIEGGLRGTSDGIVNAFEGRLSSPFREDSDFAIPLPCYKITTRFLFTLGLQLRGNLFYDEQPILSANVKQKPDKFIILLQNFVS
jgi:hypothetical protein